MAESSIDLVSRSAREAARATFVIRNEGDQPLRLEVGTPSPATPPMTLELEGDPVPPGKEGKIKISIVPGALTGPVAYRIPVKTNDPRSRDLTLRLMLTDRAPLVAKPGSLRYSAVEDDPETTVVVDVSSTDGEKFRVLRVDVPEGVKATFEEAKPDQRREGATGSQWRVTAKLSAVSAQPSATKLVIVTDHPKQKEITVPIYKTVTPLLSSLPAAVVLNPDDAGNAPPVVVHLMSVRDVEISRVTSTVPNLEIEFKQDRTPRSFKLRVSSTQPLPPGPVEGTIDVTLAGDRPYTFKIPVRRLMPPPPGSDVPGL
ncbi:DUF1573 domain-containing protein [Candidatus Binatia bacterium]|nr:DUF1573 domain-containing protein [Candidatus Binatia bacterium]